MKKTFYIFLLIVLLSCNNKNDETGWIIIDENDNASRLEDTNIPDISQDLNELPYAPQNIEVVFRNGTNYGGIVCSAKIEDDVNVYFLPSTDSRIKDTLSKNMFVEIIGNSDKEKLLENGDDAFWVKIHYGDAEWFNEDAKIGWILSSYTNLRQYYTSNLEIERKEMTKWGNTMLIGTYRIGDVVHEFNVYAKKLENQEFYSFSWDHTIKKFHYSNKPGLYIWYEKQNELRHISYIGGEGLKYGFSDWTIVTDDFKYLIQDQGTAPPPRIINIWNLENGEEIFTANYYVDINLKGHSIEIVKQYNQSYKGEWGTGNKKLTDEEIIFAENYIKKNDLPEKLREFDFAALLLVYEYNIETKERKMIDGKYVPSQPEFKLLVQRKPDKVF